MILRELLVKLGLDIDEAKFAKGNLAAEAIKAGFSKAVDMAGELVRGFVDNINQQIEYGNRVKHTAQAIGLHTDALQELQYAARMAHVSEEDLATSMGILSRNMYAANKGGDEQAKAFQQLGIKLKDANGKLRDSDDVMSDVANNFAHMEDGATKTALAMKLFGRGGKAMIPLLNEGSAGLDEMRQEAHELGLVMGEDAVNASAALTQNLIRIKAVAEGLWRGAVAPLIPEINTLVKRFLEWRKENAKIMQQRLRWFLGMLIQGVTFLADAFKFLHDNAVLVKIIMGTGGLIWVFTALSAALGTLTTASIAAAAASLTAWLAAAAPFVAIGAAIAGIMLIFDDLRVYASGKGKSVFGLLEQQLNKWLNGPNKKAWFVVAIQEFVFIVKQAIEMMKELESMLGGSQVTMNRARKEHPEYFREDGQYIGSDLSQKIIPNSGGKTATIRRGRMTIGGQEVRPDNGYSQELRGGPEYRAPSGGGGGSSETNVKAPIQIGPNIQQPGEHMDNFTQRVVDLATQVFQGQLQSALPGVRGK